MKNLNQLTLNLCLNDSFSFANFFTGSNQQLVQVLSDLYREHSPNFIYFWGQSGSGKTHLLSAVCQVFSEHQLKTVYLSFEDLAEFTLQIFDGLEAYDLICIDDLHLIAGNREWEEQVFCCFNEVLARNKRIIITANLPPSDLQLVIVDLKSRMMGGLVFALQPLDDFAKIASLKFRAKLRGLELNDQAAHFLLTRYERNPKNLFAVLATLDKAALTAQRKLTIPFIKEILNHEVV